MIIKLTSITNRAVKRHLALPRPIARTMLALAKTLQVKILVATMKRRRSSSRATRTHSKISSLASSLTEYKKMCCKASAQRR
jgi:hypothetical protein